MRDFSFILSGDPEEDAKEAAHIRRSAAYEAEGLCPNGCAPMQACADENMRGCFQCPVCYCVTNYDPMVKRA